MQELIKYRIHTIFLIVAVTVSFGIYRMAAAQHDDHDHEEAAVADAHDEHGNESACCPEEEHEDHDADHDEHGDLEHSEGDACCPEEEHGDHEDHDHEAEPADSHEGHDQEAESADSHEGHDHEGEGGLDLNQNQMKDFGIHLETAGSGSIDVEKRFPGEVRVNTDRLARVLPRATGIVRDVYVNLGDTVKKGEVLAWIESGELGEAKVAYLNAISEINCCAMDLTRAQEIHDNTLNFIALLMKNPSLQDLRAKKLPPMGENGSLLVSAYSELLTERSKFERERILYEKKISSRLEFEDADNTLKKAEAEYEALVDTVTFTVKKELAEAKEDQLRQNTDASGAERNLLVLGLSPEEIAQLREEEFTPGVIGSTTHECDDPNCTGCGADGMSSEEAKALDMLGCYALRAPLDGMVIEKTIAPGEKVEDDETVFTVADLSRVWVDFNVFQQDIPLVSKGKSVRIVVSENHLNTEGTIDYVSPLVDERTRTVMARVALPNTDGVWRPGLFVDVILETRGETVPIAVPRAAVQNMDGENIVFVEAAEGFAPALVRLGHSNTTTVEVISGLAPGQRYVVDGAFELKAHMLTQSMDPHAGHGH